MKAVDQILCEFSCLRISIFLDQKQNLKLANRKLANFGPKRPIKKCGQLRNKQVKCTPEGNEHRQSEGSPCFRRVWSPLLDQSLHGRWGESSKAFHWHIVTMIYRVSLSLQILWWCHPEANLASTALPILCLPNFQRNPCFFSKKHSKCLLSFLTVRCPHNWISLKSDS